MKRHGVGLHSEGLLMPPTRGHDLKRVRAGGLTAADRMPPTRGHDLKPLRPSSFTATPRMPPTRGHDLKP